MWGMAKFNRDNRLQADSIEEITKAFSQSVLDLTGRVQYHEAKLRPGHLLNAVVLWFAEKPKEERLQIAREALARLEAVTEAGVETIAMETEGKPPNVSRGAVEHPEPAPRKKRAGGH